MWSTDICCHRELIHHWIQSQTCCLVLLCTWPLFPCMMGWIKLLHHWSSQICIFKWNCSLFSAKGDSEFYYVPEKKCRWKKNWFSGYHSNGEACEVCGERLLWTVSVCLSWGRWGWLTGSAFCTPDTVCSSSSASWRRRSRKWGVQFARERCSRSSAETDKWDTGLSRTRAVATLPTCYAPGRGWQRLGRWRGVLVRVPASR